MAIRDDFFKVLLHSVFLKPDIETLQEKKVHMGPFYNIAQQERKLMNSRNENEYLRKH